LEPEPGSWAPGPPRLPERESDADVQPEADPEPNALVIPAPDPETLQTARALVAGHPQLGRLSELVVWLAGAQGTTPPRPFASPVALVVAAVHDAARYVDGRSESSVPQRVSALEVDSMRVRLVDLSAPGEWQVRASTGPIGQSDGLTDDEALRAFALGRLAVDQEVDGGTDVLLVGDIADDNRCSVAALAAVLTATEPTKTVRRDTDPAAWARAVEVVRDARQRGKIFRGQPLPLLAAIGGPDLAALAGMLVQAAIRRTPALLDGAAAHVAGLVAEAYAEGSVAWWSSASSSGDPAEALARRALGLDPVLALDLGFDACGGALLAYPLIQSALRLLDDPPGDAEAAASS
ncbi:MAG TPA: nicotinate-nucleotide--dimethylbenzimidazole phosphoribosyltransferase, partial [Mycobacteriales bacterium]